MDLDSVRDLLYIFTTNGFTKVSLYVYMRMLTRIYIQICLSIRFSLEDFKHYLLTIKFGCFLCFYGFKDGNYYLQQRIPAYFLRESGSGVNQGLIPKKIPNYTIPDEIRNDAYQKLTLQVWFFVLPSLFLESLQSSSQTILLWNNISISLQIQLHSADRQLFRETIHRE